jgi:hypothetical protein
LSEEVRVGRPHIIIIFTIIIRTNLVLVGGAMILEVALAAAVLVRPVVVDRPAIVMVLSCMRGDMAFNHCFMLQTNDFLSI